MKDLSREKFPAPPASGRFAHLVATRVLAERLRRAVANGTGADGLPRATISIGLAAYRSGDTAHDLIARADAALYAAKDAGRNKVREAA